MDFDRLLEKQKELMHLVPHGVRIDMAQRMLASQDMVRSLLVYLNSLGHKPWRPNPLDPHVTFENLNTLLQDFSNLISMHGVKVSDKKTENLGSRRLVSMFGIIEEAVEYIDGTTDIKKTRNDQLEELTDILFFYLEMVAMSTFTLDEIEAEYDRKHAVNLQRYADAEKGNWDWDKRGETNGL